MEELKWRKASRSGSNGGDCVEVTRLNSDLIGIRDSKNPAAGNLSLDRPDAAALISAVKSGRYDL